MMILVSAGWPNNEFDTTKNRSSAISHLLNLVEIGLSILSIIKPVV